MLHRRSIRLRIIVLVLVPVIGLLGLYAEVLNLTLGKVLTLRQEASIRNLVALPVADVQRQLGSERGVALAYLARPGQGYQAVLVKQGKKTDKAISDFSTAVQRALASGPPAKERQAFVSWQAILRKVSGVRKSVISLRLTKIEAADAYSSILDGGDTVLNQAIAPVLTGPLGIQAADLLSMAKAAQALGEESDLVRADLIAGSFPPEDLMLINQLAVQHQEQAAQTTPDLDPVLRGYFRTMIPQSAVGSLGAMEGSIAAGPSGASQLKLPAWTSASTAYRNGFRAALLKATKTLAQEATNQAKHLVIDLLIIAGIGLLAILAVIVVGILLGRGLIRQLSDLRQSAVKLSTDQLPSAISRLRAGEDLSVGAEVPQLEPGNDEIGQVREAFNTAARTAIGAAVDEIKIRQGVNDVFRSLARRNQSLLTRQLQLLDSMERRVHDPEELADLFRVDHMTTRMRRHAEGLLIVAGGSSGRTWREPVPIVDVMRAAAAEVEDYTRVRVNSRTGSALAGHAVADVIHLLAELLENAATFSPANTPVRVDGGRVGRGVVVEIEDRGLGMGEDQLAAINATLSDPPLFDLSGSDQLGLFIAGQLGKRHDVKVTLRSSAYGGVTAVVLIPTDLIIDTEPDEGLAIAGIRELGGRPVPELPGGVLEPALTLAAAPAASSPGNVIDLDTRVVIEPEPASATEVPAAAEVPGVPSWLTEPAVAAPAASGPALIEPVLPEPVLDEPLLGEPVPPEPVLAEPMFPEPRVAEHHAWPGAVPLVSGPLPASSTMTGGPAAGATATGATATGATAAGGAAASASLTGAAAATGDTTTGPVAGSLGIASPATSAATSGRAAEPLPDSQTGAGTAAGGLHVELPTRRPGTTGLAWGENSLAGTRWAGFPLSRGASGSPSGDDTGSANPWRGAVVSGSTPDDASIAGVTATGSAGRAAADGASDAGEAGPANGDSAAEARPVAAAPSAASPSGSSFTKAEQVRPAELATSEELDGLPVRVRQASLAPQLRKQTTAAQPTADEPAGPSPEAARSTMAAIQLGWQRGRSSTAPQDGAERAGDGDAEPSTAAEGAGDTESATTAKAADGEFRTTPSPKRGSNKKDEGGSE